MIKLILLPALLVYLFFVCAYAVLKAVWLLGVTALDGGPIFGD